MSKDPGVHLAPGSASFRGPSPFRPVLRGLLLTGTEPIYLRAEPGAADRTQSVAARGRLPSTAEAASDRPLWWPPAKVAGRYLAPYLATARPSRLETAVLADRPAPLRPASGMTTR